MYTLPVAKLCREVKYNGRRIVPTKNFIKGVSTVANNMVRYIVAALKEEGSYTLGAFRQVVRWRLSKKLDKAHDFAPWLSRKTRVMTVPSSTAKSLLATVKKKFHGDSYNKVVVYLSSLIEAAILKLIKMTFNFKRRRTIKRGDKSYSLHSENLWRAIAIDPKAIFEFPLV